MATTADSRPVALTGDDDRAEVVVEGPDDDWLSGWGTTRIGALVKKAVS